MRFAIKEWRTNLLACFILMGNLVMLNSCNKNVEERSDTLEQRFENYMKEQGASNFGGVKSIECVDSITYSWITDLEAQIDSFNNVKYEKVDKVAEYYGNLSNYKKQQLEPKYLEICQELMNLDKDKKIGDSDPMWELKKIWADISPLNEPIRLYKIVANIDQRETIFHGVVCGDNVSFVASDNAADVVLKNEKLEQLMKAYFMARESKLIPIIKFNLMMDKMINGDI